MEIYAVSELVSETDEIVAECNFVDVEDKYPKLPN